MSPNLVQRLSAEGLGTLALVYFGVAATLAATAGTLGVALAYAITLALAVWIFAGVSGAHVNPTVTIALAIRGRSPGATYPATSPPRWSAASSPACSPGPPTARQASPPVSAAPG